MASLTPPSETPEAREFRAFSNEEAAAFAAMGLSKDELELAECGEDRFLIHEKVDGAFDRLITDSVVVFVQSFSAKILPEKVADSGAVGLKQSLSIITKKKNLRLLLLTSLILTVILHDGSIHPQSHSYPENHPAITLPNYPPARDVVRGTGRLQEPAAVFCEELAYMDPLSPEQRAEMDRVVNAYLLEAMPLIIGPKVYESKDLVLISILEPLSQQGDGGAEGK